MISVIVPIYKVEKYLQRCIDSIISQTYQDYELILVDDGSPDRCPQICNEAEKLDRRVVVIHKQNGGLSDARNAGIDIAKGEYITFVDSDDMIAPNAFEILMNAEHQTKADIVISSKYKIFCEDIHCVNAKSGEIEEFDSAGALENVFCKTGRWEAWGVLYKRKLFDNNRFPTGKIYEDIALIPQLIMRAERVTFVDAAIYYYYKRTDSIMGSSQAKIKVDLVEHCEMLINRISDELENDARKEIIISGILMELASRIDLAEENVKDNIEFIRRGRRCIRKNFCKVIHSKRHRIKRKIYCGSFGFYFDYIWRPVYKVCKINSSTKG